MPKTTFLFFSLHTHVLPFTEGQIRIGDMLLGKGCQPVFVIISKCTCSLPLNFLQEQSGRAVKCEQCCAEEELLKKTLKGWLVYNLADYSQNNDLADTNQSLDLIDWHDVAGFSFRGIDIGKAALHDVALKFKIDTTFFQEHSHIREEYKAILCGCIITLLRFQRLFDALKADAVIVYNANYSINRSIAMHCELHGVPVYSMTGGNSLRHVWDTLILTKGSSMDVHRSGCDLNWRKGAGERVSDRHEVRAVGEHFEELLAGRKSHAYSAPAGSSSPSSLIPCGQSPNSFQSVLLLCLSSPDEYVACMTSGICPDYPRDKYLFATQIDMVNFLISKVAEDRDLHLIIRVHPREFPNKREGRISENALRLQEVFKDLPQNVTVNWPDQQVSFYDLMQHVDIVLAAGSTTLLESSVFGCPIVLPYSPLRYYDSCANVVCKDREAYWQSILEFSEKPWSVERSIKSFRWYWMMLFGSTISIKGTGTRRCTFQEWLLRGIDYTSKKAFRGKPPYTTISDAYSGGFKKLMHRPVNPIGAEAAFAVLNGEIDPMADFQELQRLQGIRSSCAAPSKAAEDEEKNAVLEELARLARIMQLNRDKHPRSKFLDMLERESSQQPGLATAQSGVE
jgi:hypothetical protein